MPNVIYTKKARKSIKSLDIRVKDGIEKIPFGDIIEIVDEKEIDTVCRILLKFVQEDAATPDEVEAIKEARQEIERGELFSHEDVWA